MRLPFLILVLCLLSIGMASAGPVVLFDEGHAQPFLAGGERPLDLSALAEVFAQSGYTILTSPEPLGAELLARADVLVISGPFEPIAVEEVEAVMHFIEQGGGLALMLHIGPPLAPLLRRLDVDFSNGAVRETQHVVADNPQDFAVKTFVRHPLTDGLTQFTVYGSWALQGTAPRSEILARTSGRSWVDLNRDRRLTPGDAVQSFGVLVAGTLGKGRYVVFGDDALFQNRFLDADNRQLATNLAEWLKP